MKRLITILALVLASAGLSVAVSTPVAHATATNCTLTGNYNSAGRLVGGWVYCRSVTGGYWYAAKVTCMTTNFQPEGGARYGIARYLAYQTSEVNCSGGYPLASSLTYVTGPG